MVGTEEVLDLSSAPLDLRVGESHSGAGQVDSRLQGSNGHIFSDQSSVLRWSDQLWRVRDIMAAAELGLDWEEEGEVVVGPWRYTGTPEWGAGGEGSDLEGSEGEESGEEGRMTDWGELSVFGSCSKEWGREGSSPGREACSSPAPQLPTSASIWSSKGEAEVPGCRGVRKVEASDSNMVYEGACRGVVQEEQLDGGHMEEGGELQEGGPAGGDMEVGGLHLEEGGLLGGADGEVGENWRKVQQGGDLVGASLMEEDELEGDTRSLPVIEGGLREQQGGGLQRLEEGMLGFVRDVDDDEDIGGRVMREGEGGGLLQDLDLLLESLAQEPGQNLFTGRVVDGERSRWSPATDRGELGARLVTAVDRSSPAGSSSGLGPAGDGTELSSPQDSIMLGPAVAVMELGLPDDSSLLGPAGDSQEISPDTNNTALGPAEDIQALSAHSPAENTPALGPAEVTPAADIYMQHWRDSIEQLAAINLTPLSQAADTHELSPAGNTQGLSPAPETETRIQEDKILEAKVHQEARIQDDAMVLRVRSRNSAVGSWDSWVVERREAGCWRCLGEAG